MCNVTDWFREGRKAYSLPERAQVESLNRAELADQVSAWCEGLLFEIQSAQGAELIENPPEGVVEITYVRVKETYRA